jgi:hypothetical protein
MAHLVRSPRIVEKTRARRPDFNVLVHPLYKPAESSMRHDGVRV